MVAMCAQLRLSNRFGAASADKIACKIFDPQGAAVKARIRLDQATSTANYDGLRVTFIPTTTGTYSAMLMLNERIVSQQFQFEYTGEASATLLTMRPVTKEEASQQASKPNGNEETQARKGSSSPSRTSSGSGVSSQHSVTSTSTHTPPKSKKKQSRKASSSSPSSSPLSPSRSSRAGRKHSKSSSSKRKNSAQQSASTNATTTTTTSTRSSSTGNGTMISGQPKAGTCIACGTTSKVVVVDGRSYCRKHFQKTVMSQWTGISPLKYKELVSALAVFSGVANCTKPPLKEVSFEQCKAMVMAYMRDEVERKGVAEEEVLALIDIELTLVAPLKTTLSQQHFLHVLARMLNKKLSKLRRAQSAGELEDRGSNMTQHNASSKKVNRQSSSSSALGHNPFSGDRRSDSWMLY